MQLYKSIFILSIALLLFAIESTAQSADIAYTKPTQDHDTNYIETYPEYISTRLYLSRKFTGIELVEDAQSTNLDFQPNTTLNLGIGATVKGFTLNLAYGFRFLNQNDERGKTTYLDLQSHLYGRKYAADVFGQFYSGMYLSNSEEVLGVPSDTFYVRPDISIVLLGGSYFRVHSPEKFSYAASLVQNEWQKKSAGSFLWGGKLILMGAIADTSFIPTFNDDTLFDAFDGVNQFSSFQFGPGVGYAHTFVVDQHWFFTMALELNIMFGTIRYSVPEMAEQKEWQVNPAADFKLALGYNSPKSYFGFSYIQDAAQIKSVDESVSALFSVGNVRINYVKRFKMGPKLKEKIDKLPI